MLNTTDNKIFTFSTGRLYNFEQVLEFVFVERKGDNHFYYIEDRSRDMSFPVKVTLVDPENETEISLGRKILEEYDTGSYTKVSWEVEVKGKKIFNELKQNN